MTHQQNEKLNPLLSVWLHPKKTTQYVIEQKDLPYCLFIIAISFIGVLSSSLIDTELYPLFSTWTIVMLLLILSPIIGMTSNAIYALFIWAVGKIFNGSGTYKNTFKGLSLTAIPSIILIPFYIAWLITDPYSLFHADAEGSFALPFISLILTIVTGIWSFVITIATISQLHNVSNWKAFFIILITAVIFTILLTIFIVIVALVIIGAGVFFIF